MFLNKLYFHKVNKYSGNIGINLSRLLILTIFLNNSFLNPGIYINFAKYIDSLN